MAQFPIFLQNHLSNFALVKMNYLACKFLAFALGLLRLVSGRERLCRGWYLWVCGCELCQILIFKCLGGSNLIRLLLRFDLLMDLVINLDLLFFCFGLFLVKRLWILFMVYCLFLLSKLSGLLALNISYLILLNWSNLFQINSMNHFSQN